MGAGKLERRMRTSSGPMVTWTHGDLLQTQGLRGSPVPMRGGVWLDDYQCANSVKRERVLKMESGRQPFCFIVTMQA